MSYIKFDNLSKSFDNNEVLKDINLEIEKGELVTLLGPSGCGKSTLLRCLAGLEQVTSGRIFLDGKEITDLSPRNREIGMVFQQYSLFPNMSVAQNIAFGLKMKKIHAEDIKSKTSEILDVIDMTSKKDQYPAQLSGGQQQRVALARAIVTEPKVLLLDEPLSAIDALLRRSLQTEIRRIQKTLGITAIFVTHDQDEAMVMSDMIHLFYEGHIQQSGSPVELYTKPNSNFSATFIGHYNIIEAKDFEKIFSCKVDCEKVAIRPEVITLSEKSAESSDTYQTKINIINFVSHGNIIRYTTSSEVSPQVLFHIDLIYTHRLLYSIGQAGYLTINKDDCILL